MKIGILTFHRADNHGALLQTYSLQQILTAWGHDVDVVDYRCALLENDYIKLYSSLPPKRRNKILWTRDWLKRRKITPILRRKSAKCAQFRDSFVRMTESVYTDDERVEIENTYDLILTGSDQIWSPVLTHGKDDWYAFKKSSYGKAAIVAYGASVGHLKRFDSVFRDYESNLAQYDGISVREGELQAYLAEHLKKPIYKVLDPTLLTDKSSWDKLVSVPPIKEGQYVLFYEVEFHEEAFKIAQEIAKNKSLTLVHFDATIKKMRNVICVQDSGPSEFLGWVKNAAYVVTSSFHGTVFSILFQKKFTSVLPGKVGARICDLLMSLGLQDRIVETYADFDISMCEKEWDQDAVVVHLEELKESSFDYLRQCLNMRRNPTWEAKADN